MISIELATRMGKWSSILWNSLKNLDGLLGNKSGRHLSISSHASMVKDSSMDINSAAFLESARTSAKP